MVRRVRTSRILTRVSGARIPFSSTYNASQSRVVLHYCDPHSPRHTPPGTHAKANKVNKVFWSLYFCRPYISREPCSHAQQGALIFLHLRYCAPHWIAMRPWRWLWDSGDYKSLYVAVYAKVQKALSPSLSVSLSSSPLPLSSVLALSRHISSCFHLSRSSMVS